jgi:hypothetical protein
MKPEKSAENIPVVTHGKSWGWGGQSSAAIVAQFDKVRVHQYPERGRPKTTKRGWTRSTPASLLSAKTSGAIRA